LIELKRVRIFLQLWVISDLAFDDILVVDDARHHWRIDKATGIIPLSLSRSWKQKGEAKEMDLNPQGHFSVRGPFWLAMQDQQDSGVR
jgi:hypothetical protein